MRVRLVAFGFSLWCHACAGSEPTERAVELPAPPPPTAAPSALARPRASAEHHAEAPRIAPPNPRAAEAEVLFGEGRELMAAGKPALACEKFEASAAIEVALGTLLNLGDCREKLKDNKAACEAYRQALLLATSGDARATFIENRSRALGCPP